MDAKLPNFSLSQHISHSLLLHVSSSVKIAALKLFIHSTSSTKPLTHDVLLALQQNLPLFHGETDSRARNEFVSVIKKLFSRLQGIIPRLFRVQDESPIDSESSLALTNSKGSGLLEDHVGFLQWYIRFLHGELQPVAPYQRHISALRIMHHLSVSGMHRYLQHGRVNHAAPVGKEEAHNDFYDPSLLRLLLDLVVDPFDDVRSAAAALLQAVPKKTLVDFSSTPSDKHLGAHQRHGDGEWEMSLALERAEALMRQTGRADYADGVGRLHDVLYGSHGLAVAPADSHRERATILEELVKHLENDIQLAQHDLQQAILSAPLHGHLIALR